ncbi:MAG TPA: short-chain dehydrogenase, partial [Ruminococcaceae bacterium]|nr:short-chain dehydrogenase [Oscillospiraceae bacterium]
MSKAVFITGGASGIGRASAIAFAKAGENVFIIDIDIDGMN